MAPTPAPLPVVPDRAVLSNRIDLVLSRQAALAKAFLGRAPDPPAVGGRDADAGANADGLAAVPNAGPGYVPEKRPSAARAQDRLLRGRLRLGTKRHAPGGGVGSGGHGDEDGDEEQGRSALGRRKRARRRLETDAAAHADAPGRADPVPDPDPAPRAGPERPPHGEADDGDAGQSQTPGRAIEAPADGDECGSRHDAAGFRTKKRSKNKSKKSKDKGPP